MTGTRAQPARGGLVLLAIVALAVTIRVLYTLLEAPWPPVALDDQFYFSALPKLLADGHGFIGPFKYAFDGVVTPTAEHPPLYSLVLAAPAAIGLDSDDAFRLAGTVFGAGTVAVTFLIGRRLAGPRAGLVAAGLAAIHPALVAADGALMSETLYGLLTALMLLAALRLLESPAAWTALALGAVAGLAALTRGEALLLLPLVLVPTLRQPGGARAAAVAAVAFVVVLAPWTVRNWIVFDQPVLVATNSGTAVAGANCRETYSGSRLGGWWPDCIREHPGNEAEHHAKALDDGVRYAREHAGRLPVVLAARLGRVWSVYEPFQIPEGRSPRVQKAGTLFFFLLVPLGLVGALRMPDRRTLWILLAPVVVVSLTALLTYGNVRFREPAEISAVLLAAVGIDALWRRR